MEITKEMIKDFENLGGEVWKAYLTFKDASRIWDSCTDRYQFVTTSKGETLHIDLSTAWPWIERKLKKHDVSASVIGETYQIYKSVNTIKIAVAKTKRELYRAMPEKFSKSPLNYRRDYIIDLFASFYTPKQVQSILKRQGYSIQPKALKEFAYKHKTKIKELQEKKIDSKDSLLLGNETTLLEHLSEFHFHYFQEWEETKSKEALKQCYHCIDLASRILKTNKIELKVDGHIDLNASIHGGKVLQKSFESGLIYAWVVSLAAEKLGTNSLILLDELSKSYYSELSGIFETAPDLEDYKSKTIYPSTLVRTMNWKNLDRRYKDPEKLTQIEKIRITETTPSITKTEQEQAADKTKILRHLLSEMRISDTREK